MSKIIVRRQEYANNGTHANEIEAVVKQNLIVNTLSSALDVAPSVGLMKNAISSLIKTREEAGTTDGTGNLGSISTTNYLILGAYPVRSVNASAYSVFITTTDSGGQYMLHFVDADGAIVANQSVKAIVIYVEK